MRHIDRQEETFEKGVFLTYEMRTMRASARFEMQKLSALWSGDCGGAVTYFIQGIARYVVCPGAFSLCWGWRYVQWHGGIRARVGRASCTELLERSGSSFCTADACISETYAQSLRKYA
jgi:hypothetical protein